MVRQDPAMDGPSNMAADIELLERAERGEICGRVYAWEGPWVSLGRFQSPSRDLVQGNATPFVMRPTGGKAVLHGHDATIGLAIPLTVLHANSREVKKAYRGVIAPIIAAMVGCGISAELAEGTKHVATGVRTADCFAFNSPNDVIDPTTGQKLCGCALRLTERAVLVQASIPNGRPLIDPKLVLPEASDYVGPTWDSSRLWDALEQALRYNFAHVSA